MSALLINPLAQAFLISLTAALVIWWTRSYHGKFSYDSVSGVQKMHHEQVPRIGGLAIFLGFSIAQLGLDEPAQEVVQPTLALACIAFSFGFLEDITKTVPVAMRLWATMVPGVVGYFLTGYTLNQFGYAWLDAPLQWPILAVAFMAFAIAGVTHAINMIDGFNGLASWTAVWILLGIALLALMAGDFPSAVTCLLLIASIGGFLLLNWPWGKLFLGDGGAYLLGVSIAWLCVTLVNRNPQISPFACLVLCSYPIVEVLYSIYRRIKNRRSSGQPDSLHLHQLIAMTIIYPRLRGRFRPLIKNSATGITISTFTLIPLALALTFAQNQNALVLCFAGIVLAYVALYRLVHSRLGRADPGAAHHPGKLAAAIEPKKNARH